MSSFRNEKLQAALVLAFFVNVFFFPFLWGPANILASARDAASILPDGAVGTSAPIRPSRYMDPVSGTATLEPVLALEQRLYFKEHQAPLWNPDVAFGAPLAADMVAQPFYPLTILAALHPSPTTFAWFVAVRLFAAGFLTFLFLRFFVPFVPAVFGATAFMFTGYFILYLTICHVSVEVLMGALFYGAEWLLRTRSWRAMGWTAAAVWLVMLGGMPESALLAVGLSTAYFIFRLLTDARLRVAWMPLMARYAGANLAGVAGAAFLLLPFVEYVGNSFNTHQAEYIGAFRGLRDVDRDLTHLASYLAPLIYGPLWRNITTGFSGFSGMFGYTGFIAFYFALLAVVVAVRRRHAGSDPTWFFAAAAIGLILKHFGSPLVNWIGALPVLRYVIFDKYGEPLIAFCCAALCALGLAHVASRSASRRDVAAASLIAALGLSLLYVSTSPAIALLSEHQAFYYAGLLSLLVLLALASLASWLFLAPDPGHWIRHAFPLLAVGALFVELGANFYGPMFYLLSPVPDKATNPYRGAPYIDFLHANLRQDERVLGEHGVLEPDWSEAFGLRDVGDLDGLYYKKYFPFLRTFLKSEADPGDMKNYFHAYDERTFSEPLEQRFLRLSSVRYVVAPNAIPRGERSGAGKRPLQLVYDAEVKIYRFVDPVPRAAFYGHVEVAADDAAVLRKLADPKLDVATTAVLNQSALPPSDLAAARALAAQPPGAAEPATITSYTSGRVSIEANPRSAGILVLNDSDYPGWRAYVDGRAVPIQATNYLFRGLFLAPGHHAVEFRYEPVSFRAGLAISLLALVSFLAFALVDARRGGNPTSLEVHRRE